MTWPSLADRQGWFLRDAMASYFFFFLPPFFLPPFFFPPFFLPPFFLSIFFLPPLAFLLFFLSFAFAMVS